MTNDEVNKKVQEICGEIQLRSVHKGQLYTGADEDRLGMFRQQAQVSGCTPEQVLMVLMSKNFYLLSHFIHTLSIGKEIVPAEWDDKIYDMILYLILLKIIVTEGKST